MNIQSYTIVHYGADYLGYALQSVFPCVDQMHVIYTPHPSHGYQTDIPPIETKEQIQQSIPAYLFEKVRWHEMRYVYQEGEQRDMAVQLCQDNGADIVLVVDCDEVWPQETLENILDIAKSGETRARNWLVNMVHLWRSFNWCCRDNGWPVRIIDLRTGRAGIKYLDRRLGEVYHFGYCVCNEVMQYKWLIHGHKGELRPGWLDNQWQEWPPQPDCHPTNGKNDEGVGFWNPEPFDKEQLPELMRAHPFWGLERIG